MNNETPGESHRGKLLLIGFGPGAHEHLTFRARAAIAEAEVVIGYSTYIKLIADLLDGKEVHRKGMSEELIEFIWLTTWQWLVEKLHSSVQATSACTAWQDPPWKYLRREAGPVKMIRMLK